jgi:hypothetical protein
MGIWEVSGSRVGRQGTTNKGKTGGEYQPSQSPFPISLIKSHEKSIEN